MAGGSGDRKVAVSIPISCKFSRPSAAHSAFYSHSRLINECQIQLRFNAGIVTRAGRQLILCKRITYEIPKSLHIVSNKSSELRTGKSKINMDVGVNFSTDIGLLHTLPSASPQPRSVAGLPLFCSCGHWARPFLTGHEACNLHIFLAFLNDLNIYIHGLLIV